METTQWMSFVYSMQSSQHWQHPQHPLSVGGLVGGDDGVAVGCSVTTVSSGFRLN